MRRFLTITAKEVQFLYNTTVYSLLLMALLFTLQPFVLPPDSRADEIKTFTSQLAMVDANKVASDLQSIDGKPTMLFVYASWCGYCRRMMPDVMELKKNHGFDNIHTLFVSRDTENDRLAEYLVHHDYHTLVTPYIIDPHEFTSLLMMLQFAGSKFEGGIPYTGFYDSSGKLIMEIQGVAGKRVLQEALLELKRNSR